MNRENEFKKIVAQYCEVSPENMTDEMKFREDLGFSSLDFMSFLGELEDTFDVELDEESVLKVFTIGQALEMLNGLEAA
ncbi:MAG: acyl carrier protein [Lachnospiraceae bacterium]|nr:acyl carrier protein [Lachnospiraceae bacterium]